MNVLKLFVMTCVLACTCSNAQAKAKLAIVIDDIGYQQTDYKLLALGYPLTYAVLPHQKHSASIAKTIQEQGHDVLLHMPMESARRADLSKDALKINMSQEQIEHMLSHAFADVPQAIGMNNHMGSYFTEQQRVMDWTLGYLAKRNLFFLDSKTTAKSTGQHYAKEHNLPFLVRHVFLDNDRSTQALDKQFNLALSLAQKQNHAILIGHPYPETYLYLKGQLPTLSSRGIELVPLSHFLPQDYKITRAKDSVHYVQPRHESQPAPVRNSSLMPVAKPKNKALAPLIAPSSSEPKQRDYQVPPLLNPLSLSTPKAPKRLQAKLHLKRPVKPEAPGALPFYQLGRIN